MAIAKTTKKNTKKTATKRAPKKTAKKTATKRAPKKTAKKTATKRAPKAPRANKPPAPPKPTAPAARSEEREGKALPLFEGVASDYAGEVAATGGYIETIDELALTDIEVVDNKRKRQDTDQEIESLADSMSDAGQLQPIIVRPVGKQDAGDPIRGNGALARKYVLIAGHRRLRAAQHLGWRSIRAEVREGATSAETLLENLQRKDLTFWEKVAGVTELRANERRPDGKRFTVRQIAAKLGLSKSYIDKMLTIGTRLHPAIAAKLQPLGELPAHVKVKEVDRIARLPQDQQPGAWDELQNPSSSNGGSSNGTPRTRARSGDQVNELKSWVDGIDRIATTKTGKDRLIIISRVLSWMVCEESLDGIQQFISEKVVASGKQLELGK